jgi:mannose/fructose/N-acetylgalactosamine-specific phosphotransferase system component IIB
MKNIIVKPHDIRFSIPDLYRDVVNSVNSIDDIDHIEITNLDGNEKSSKVSYSIILKQENKLTLESLFKKR